MSVPVASEFHFYTDIFNRLNGLLQTYVSDTSSAVAGTVSGVATQLVVIYVMLWGWLMMRGMIQEPMLDGVSRIIRMSIIVAAATSIGVYNEYVRDFLWNLPDDLARLVAAGHADNGGNVSFLDTLFGRMYDVGAAYKEKANSTGGMLPDLDLLAAGWVIWIIGLGATLFGAFWLILSKLMLALLLAIGPIFILTIMFEGTKRFFDAWIGQALNYVLLAMLASAVMQLLFFLVTAYLDSAFPLSASADPNLSAIFPLVAISAICIVAMLQVPTVASALSGGVALSSMGAVGWAIGKTASSMSGMRPTNLRRSLHKASADARIVRGAAKATAGAPLGVYRRITGGRANRMTKG
ncbi:conjugal transfer protein [Ralstonia mannitolilytica]|uniref:type IV secretion system protein n=1 Tax=Ralstonia mannitolilytica TaxID=105219 RepID=UPI0005D7ABD1|nr:type IV secretion system protein [Ralstonia mannitolilytica]AJW44444.1 conjugal transfer protein [Ralstonia mannitolilytica]